MSRTPAMRASLELLFNDAADLPSAERAALLDSRCAGDTALRAEVEALLREFDSGTRTFLKAETAHRMLVSEQPGDVIDKYRIVRTLGEGGFGSVYLARQTHPVQRDVALKVIKLGMDTRQVVARFGAERQTLASLDHPNIARVLDAGATSAGRPYFVMEHVPGPPITRYCDEHRLSTRMRLGLFLQVCDALKHAHQRGVIHRDIKPSNVLVQEIDGAPVAKVIDFGIARAIDRAAGDGAERTLYTEMGQLIGTPEYMSPEQAAGEANLDTRTDIYSLGVLFYELISGSLPFDAASLRSGGLAAMQRIIREAEPAKPSTRLRQRSQARDDVAAQRRAEPRGLIREIRGDLDWIALRALEKEPARRYQSVSEFGDDIRRSLGDQPVIAGPPSRVYRLRKFVKRNKVGVAAGGAIALALLLGFIAAAAGFVRASEQRDRAVAAERLALQRTGEAEAALNSARLEADKAKAVTSFLTRMLSSVKPAQALGKEVTVKAILDQASAKIAGEFAAQPDVRSELEMTIGSTYRMLERYDEAEAHLAWARDTRTDLYGLSARPTAEARIEWAHWLVDRARFDEAEEQFRALIEEARASSPPDEPFLARTLGGLGRVMLQRSKYEAAENAYREALGIRRRVLPSPSQEIADNLDSLARCFSERGKKAEAVELFKETLVMRRELAMGEASVGIAGTVNNLASVLHDLGRFDEAEEMYKESLRLNEAIFGRASSAYTQPLNNLAILYQDVGKMAEAESAFIESLELRRRVWGAEHPAIANALNSLAGVYFMQSRFEQALPLFEEALAMQRKVLGEKHAHTLVSLANVGAAFNRMGRSEEAFDVLREAWSVDQIVFGPDARQTLSVLVNLSMTSLAMGRIEEAESYACELLDRRVRSLGNEHPDTQIPRRILASIMIRDGRIGDAFTLAMEVCEIAAARAKPIQSEQRANARTFADVYEAMGNAPEAERWRAELAPK